jgi:hypothetical protein
MALFAQITLERKTVSFECGTENFIKKNEKWPKTLRNGTRKTQGHGTGTVQNSDALL